MAFIVSLFKYLILIACFIWLVVVALFVIAALDPNSPRSIAYQLTRIEAHLSSLSKREDGRLSPAEGIAVTLASKLRTADISAIDESVLQDMEAELRRLSDLVASTYFTTSERSDVSMESVG